MKTSHFWIIIVFLLGICLFGIYKSVELATRNAVLSHNLNTLKTKLGATEQSLKATRQSLGESYLKNAELEGRLMVLDKKAAEQAAAIKGHLRRIEDLTVKLTHTARANASLSGQNKEINARLFREKLEADEMRHKLSSVVELKKAIKELRVSLKQAKKKNKPVVKRPAKKKILEMPQEKAVVPDTEDGNSGFLIKDGHSTYQDFVDIRVIPAEPAAVNQ